MSGLNTRTLQPFEREVIETLRQILAAVKSIEKQKPRREDYPLPPDQD